MTINYKYWKSKNNSKGTIVFIHGFATTSDYFDSIATKLNNDYDYYALELPGMGRTEPLQKPTPYNIAVCVTKWIKQQNLKDIILIGHSMGGGVVNFVGTMLSRTEIKKIISICPMSHVITIGLLKHSNRIVNTDNIKAYKNAGSIYKYPERKFKLKQDDPDLLKDVEYFKTNYKSIKKLYKNMRSVHYNIIPLLKAVKKIHLPTLLITAEDDKIIGSKQTAKTLTKNKNVSWVEIKDSGHVPFIEQESQTLSTILEFIEKE